MLAEQSTKLNELTEKLAVVTAKLDELSKRSKGHKSERLIDVNYSCRWTTTIPAGLRSQG